MVECSGGRGKCDANIEPQATASCNLGACPVWKVGDWSQVKSSGAIITGVIMDPKQSIATMSKDSYLRRT